MKKLKLFKTLLTPSLGVLTLGTIAAVATSCCCTPEPTPVVDVREYVGITANANSTLTLYNEGGNNPNLEIQLMVELVEIHIVQQ